MFGAHVPHSVRVLLMESETSIKRLHPYPTKGKMYHPSPCLSEVPGMQKSKPHLREHGLLRVESKSNL